MQNEEFEMGLGNNKEINDAYPSQPILTLWVDPKTGQPKTAFLNEKAYEKLNLKKEDTNYVAFTTSRISVNDTYIINANGYHSKAIIKVNKSGEYSNRTNLKELNNRFSNKENRDNIYLKIVDSKNTFNDTPVFKLETYSAKDEIDSSIVTEQTEKEQLSS